MNCDQVKPLLSAFHDGELSSDQCAMVADHVSSCDDCAARVMSFQSLSALVQRSTTRPPAAELLEKVQAAISVDRALVNRTASFSYRRNVIAAILATAAAFTGIIVWQFAGRPSHDHGEMAAAFGDFLDAYSEGKNDAPEILVG